MFINFFVIKYFRFRFIFYVKTATAISPLPPAERGGGAYYEIFIPKRLFTESFQSNLSCSCNILFCGVGLANFMSNFMSKLNVLWQCYNFFQNKSVTILCIYLNIKKLVVCFEQCSSSPKMLKLLSEACIKMGNENIPQTYAVLTSIFPQKNLCIQQTCKIIKISGGYLLFGEEMGRTFLLEGFCQAWSWDKHKWGI